MSNAGTPERAHRLLGEYYELLPGELLTDDTNALLGAVLMELQVQRQAGAGPDELALFDAKTNQQQQAREPQYTSREGLTAASETSDITLGFEADTVAVRNISDDLRIAFKDPTPSGATDAWITLTASDSPFVLSGVYGISAAEMWYETASGAEHSFDLLAVKKRGR